MKSDFTNVRRWVTGARFVGREKACVDLMWYIRSNLSCVIVGLRRIGKTSVLHEIGRRLSDDDESVVIKMDLEKFTADLVDPEAEFYESFTALLDEQLITTPGQEHSDYYPVRMVSSLDGARVTTSFDLLEIMLRRHYQKTDRRVVLLLDEFDICAKWGSRMAGFLQRMRVLVDNSPENGLVCILASSRAIKMLEAKTLGDASTLSNALKTVDIAMLHQEDLWKLCDLSEADVPASSRSLYAEYSFGHPFLFGLLLHHHNALSRECAKIPSPESVRSAAILEYEDYFNELRHLFSSFPVGTDLVSTGIANWFDCLVWKEVYHANIPPHIAGTFQKYGFWNGKDVMPVVLHDFLCRHRGEVWPELRRLERGIRRFVAQKLKFYYGGRDDWFMAMDLPAHGSSEDPWRKEEDSFQRIVCQMRARRQKTQPDITVDYLDCTYLDDLMHLMLLKQHWRGDTGKNWSGFEVYFDGDVKKCREMICAAGAVRNPEAHFCDYPDRLKLRFAEADKYLSSILDRFNAESGGA